MHQFWNTIQKVKNTDAYRFKLDKKKFRVDTEVFREILQICPRILNQDFIAPPSEEELVTFIQELGYYGKCDMLSVIHIDQKHQSWRTFVAIINRCIYRKPTGLDRLRESRAQILWARKEHMPYPRFTKVIISHFIAKDRTISMRNGINLHTIRDDSLLDIRDSKAYKTYYDFATGKVPPKKARKYKKFASPLRKLSPVLEEEPAKKPKKAKKPAKKSNIVPTAGVVIRDSPSVHVSKKKAPSKGDRGKGMKLLSDAALLEAAQVKEVLQKSKKDSHMLHASGSGDRVGSQLKVLDESQDKTTSTDEGTSTKPGVPDVPKYLSKSENESWGDSGNDDNDDDSNEVTKDD
ncbi:hypothetical protein Tco_1009306, partial [Tanacetum coccineum]